MVQSNTGTNWPSIIDSPQEENNSKTGIQKPLKSLSFQVRTTIQLKFLAKDSRTGER